MTLRVICGVDPSLEFREPVETVRAQSVEEALRALAWAEASLAQGRWIAGYLSYELGAQLHGAAPRAATAPLLALGAYRSPASPLRSTTAEARVSPLVGTVAGSQYERRIASILEAIYDGEVYQVNYTVPFAFSIHGGPQALWEAIAHTTQAQYQAFVEDEGRRILSWSPELFLKFDGERITTKPMKGTSPLGGAAALRSEKNLAEHVMIVDLLRNDLHRVASAVTVERLQSVETYPTFLTMTSTISGRLDRSANFGEVIRAMFPCGSITGAPKRAAIGRIASLEDRPRGAYCGTIGYLSPQRRGWWNVAIRTAQIQGNRGDYYAGGGIVSDSKAAEEWDEVRLKTAFLRERCDAAELWETFASDAPEDVVAAHLARLFASADAFGIALDRGTLEGEIRSARACSGRQLLRLRVRSRTSYDILRDPLAPQTLPVGICFAGQRVTSGDELLRHKTAWRPAHELAALFAANHGCFDALLTNERGELTEGSRTNVFADIDGTLYTPPLHCGLLPGILRSRIVSEGRARERVLTEADVTSARAIYVGNSARGLLPARLVYA